MTRIYHMWLFVRIVEQFCLSKKTTKGNRNATDKDCRDEFIEHKTLFTRRPYTTTEALLAYSMAKATGYVVDDDKPIGKDDQEMAITGSGFAFATPSGLLALESKTLLAPISSIVAVIIAILALVVSIYKK